MNVKITKEQIKAIRVVRGLTPDLRIKARYINRESMWDFLDQNAAGLFGLDFTLKKHIEEDGSLMLNGLYERALYRFTDAIIGGYECEIEI